MGEHEDETQPIDKQPAAAPDREPTPPYDDQRMSPQGHLPQPQPQLQPQLGYLPQPYTAPPQQPPQAYPPQPYNAMNPRWMAQQDQVILVRNQYENGMAVGSLVLGILTLFTFGATCIPAIIVGHIALVRVKKRESNAPGMAWTGLALGYLSLAGWFLFWLLFVIGAAGSGSKP